MLVGKRLGPYLIEKELGSGAMGTVYRGRHTETDQKVAIKFMAPGLGSTNDNAIKRFEREAQILKQLRHPNIVGFFKAGKSGEHRFYIMEYIEGETLDKVLGRRGRVSWEEVVSFGQQLSAALQHAHDGGVVHRDLKPSNLMILADGTLKLTDFGIAKDLDVSQLTATNCTVGTAAYMSPEQCRGERDLTHKSDLYSMGVVFYELLTGKKPFNADNAMDMFMQHVQGKFERPARLVPDAPVWLDNLIAQLLEKKPEHRPLNAATVYAALGEIQEKVETQKSAGADAARKRVIDRLAGERRPDETDREAARLLAGKPKPKKKRKQPRFYERAWFTVVGAAALLVGLGVGLYAMTRPPSSAALHAQIKAVMESGDFDRQQDAREQIVERYLTLYADPADELGKQRLADVKGWADQIDVAWCEKLLQKHLKTRNKTGLKVEANTDAEKLAFDAAGLEADGKLKEAAVKWADLKTKGAGTRWAKLADAHAHDLAALQTLENDLRFVYQGELRKEGREPKLADPRKTVFAGLRAEWRDDKTLALQIYNELKENLSKDSEPLAGDRPTRMAYLFVLNKTSTLKKPDISDLLGARKKWVREWLDKARAEWNTQLLDARLACLDVVALYGDMPEMKELVDEARAMIRG